VRPQTHCPGPEIGQHNDYVLRQLLGLTDDEIMKPAMHETLE
jgi:hypothetical protein